MGDSEECGPICDALKDGCELRRAALRLGDSEDRHCCQVPSSGMVVVQIVGLRKALVVFLGCIQSRI